MCIYIQYIYFKVAHFLYLCIQIAQTLPHYYHTTTFSICFYFMILILFIIFDVHAWNRILMNVLQYIGKRGLANNLKKSALWLTFLYIKKNLISKA